MFVTKLKAAVAVVLVLGLLATGALGLGSHRAWAQCDKTRLAPIVEERATPPEKDKNAFTTSDKEVKDLQGEWAVVAMEEGGEKAPADALKGMKWVVKGNEITGSQPGGTGRMSFKLDSGKTPKEIDITALDGNLKGTTSPGIYAIEGTRLRVCFGEKVRPKTFATAPGDGRTMITLEKEVFTAWGKEINGLQAGLGFRPGQKRAYHQGEEATVVLRVRNVGKEAVEFKHIWAFFVENPPTITDAEGKPVRTAGTRSLRAATALQYHTVAPGKEVELYEWNFIFYRKEQPARTCLRFRDGQVQPSVRARRWPDQRQSKPPQSHVGQARHREAGTGSEGTRKATPEEGEGGLTAWGKEVGGLQAGLGFAPARSGPTATARRSRSSSGFATSARRRLSSSTSASSSSRTRPP